MSVVAAICQTILALSALLCTIRLVRPGTVADRIIALDTLLIIVTVGLAVDAASEARDTYIDAMIVVALVAFISTVTVARFIESRSRE